MRHENESVPRHEAARAEAAGDDGAWSQGEWRPPRAEHEVAEVAALFEAQGKGGLAALSNLFE
jgi:hypothetical protein